MVPRQKLVLFLCGLIALSSCMPASPKFSEEEFEEHPELKYESRGSQPHEVEFNRDDSLSQGSKKIGRYPGQDPLIEYSGGSPKQAAGLASLATGIVVSILGPLLNNLSTGLINGLTATMSNRTLEYIPIPGVPFTFLKGAYPHSYL